MNTKINLKYIYNEKRNFEYRKTRLMTFEEIFESD